MKYSNNKLKIATLLILLMGSFALEAQVTSFTAGTNGFGVSTYPSIYSNPYQQNQNQNQNNQATQEQNQKIKDLTAEVDKMKNQKKSETSKTAAEQGYVDSNKAQKDLYSNYLYEQDNNLRQKGDLVEQPNMYNSVFYNKNLTVWLQNWTQLLEQKGVPTVKITFESKRLLENEFNDWAKNQLLYYQKQYVGQEVYVNDPQPHDGNVIPTYKN